MSKTRISKFTRLEIAKFYEIRVPDLNQTSESEWRGPCPVHDGQDKNFAVNAATGQWFCHSQCNRGGGIIGLEKELSGSDFKTAKAEVYRIIGRKIHCTNRKRSHGKSAKLPDYAWKFLNERIQQFSDKEGVRYVCRYKYRYVSGRLAWIKAKFRRPDGKKTFQKYAPTAKGGWTTPQRAGIEPLLYNAHLLEAAQEIHFCNGEKAANAGRKLGLVTTCLPDGEGKWDESFTPFFEGKRVVVYIDNDAKGEEHGKVVARALRGHASEIRLARLPNLPPKGDLFNWIKAGGEADELRKLIDATPMVDTKLNTKSKPKARRSPFRLADDAVLYMKPGQRPVKICGRLEVVAFTRDGTGEAWGRSLKWRDAEGREHEWAMPMSLLSGDGGEYRARLLDGGLFIAPGRKVRDLLTSYIQNAQPDGWVRCADRIGWHRNKFVLPDQTIGPEDGEEVRFQSPHDAVHYWNVSGTTKHWRTNVGEKCSGNSRLILAVSCAFAGPLLTLVGAESGGVHLHGSSSTGKTTAAVVGGSVCGGGGRDGFVQSWRSTVNGLEAQAGAHNDGALFLDELSMVDPKQAAETPYLLSGGQDKNRMTRSIALRKKLFWKITFFSTGEITLAQHAESAGKRMRGGGEVRLLNVEADAGKGMGLFEDLHGAASPDAFAREMKESAQKFYGAAFRAFVARVAQDQERLVDKIRSARDRLLGRWVPPEASGEVRRAAERFALIGIAGALANQWGLTGWQEGEAVSAAKRCFQEWVTSRGTQGSFDAESGIRAVRSFLQTHGSSRFEIKRPVSYEDKVHPVHDRAGFVRLDEEGKAERFYIFPDTFRKEICNGIPYRAVLNELRKRGYLRFTPPNLMEKPNLPGLGRVWVYAVAANILEGGE